MGGRVTSHCFLRYRQSNCRYVLTRYCHKKCVKKVVLDVKKLDKIGNFTWGVGNKMFHHTSHF